MSILPTQAQGTTPSSPLQVPFPNPNSPNHGQPLSDLSRQSLPDPRPSSGAPGAEDSSDSSEKVSKLATPNGQRSSPQPQPMADPQNAPAHPNARMTRGAASPRGEHISGSRSIGSQASNHTGSGRRDTGSGRRDTGSGRRAQVTNANHLLNFHYDPIARSQPRPPPPRKSNKIKPYNKDLFLQANYKFVVLDKGNYSPELMDPDKMLQWEDIICLRYSTPSLVQCPICLDDPICPQITSCGHIFCFPCILQYLLMGKEDLKGDSFKRCPLCFMMVSVKDLYTIYIENVKQYNVGDTIEFMLLTRAKGSFAPAQKCKLETGESSDCSPSDPISKFTFTTDVDLSVRKAMSDLDGWIARAESGLVDDLEKLPYVSAAVRLLKQRKKYWSEHRASGRDITLEDADSQFKVDGLLSPESLARGDQGLKHVKHVADQSEPLGSVLNEEFDSEAFEGQDAALSSSYDETGSVPLHSHSDSHERAKDKESYNFYQAVDGQHIILHTINMKCLLHHYGSYDMLPNRIRGKILQLETVRQSEATRRRYRYLSHFSLTTTYQLCEIDLSGMLPPHAMMPFMDEMKKREKQRRQLADKERKDQIKAEVAAAAAAAADYMPVSLSIGQCSHYGPPQFSLDDFQALGSSSVMSSSPPTFGERISFSSVTRLGYAAAHDSPSLKVEPVAPGSNGGGAADPPSVADSRNPPSFANVMARGKSGENVVGTPKVKNESGKKGKKQSRVLLSTAGGRRY